MKSIYTRSGINIYGAERYASSEMLRLRSIECRIKAYSPCGQNSIGMWMCG